MTANPADAVREAPCPFCGNVGITIREGTTFRWRVAECNHCGSTCGEVRFNTTADDKLVEEISAGRRALDEWNKRADLAALAGAAPVAWMRAMSPLGVSFHLDPPGTPLFTHAPAKAREVADADVERALAAYAAGMHQWTDPPMSCVDRHPIAMRAALATFAEG